MDALKGSIAEKAETYADAMTAFDQSVSALRDSAQLAKLTDDPAAPALEAMVRVLGAVGRQFQLRDRERKEIAVAMEMRARRIAGDATGQIQASGVAIIEKLAPELSRLVERSIRQRLWTVRVNTLAIAGAIAVALSVTCFTIGYGMAYKAGRNDGLLDGKTIATAMATGPDVAHAWASLMATNDPVRALQACRAATARDTAGRRYCPMPVWLDPPPPPATGKSK